MGEIVNIIRMIACKMAADGQVVRILMRMPF